MIVPHTLPGGGRVMIESDVLDVGTRLQYGDPTLAWPGDPHLSLHWNELDRCYEVWHVGLDGSPYKVCASDRCDGDLIRKVVERDSRRGNLLAEIDDFNDREAKDRQRRFDEWVAEDLAPKLRWAIKKDLAHHLGGRL